jgi:3-ketosteroid 9alpha-monooxygenase subunit B
MSAAAQDMKRAGPVNARGPFQVEIAEVIQETPDVRSFVLAVPDRLSEVFQYRSGQFLTVEISREGQRLRRCYSLSSAPDTDDKHIVTVKRVPRGRVSGWLHDHLKPGDVVSVYPPSGQFVLHESTAPLMMFAGGSGITPIISIVKSALATTQRSVRLMFANRNAKSIIFAKELERLEAEYRSRFTVIHHLSDEAGRLSSERVRALLTERDQADCYLCGPTPFMEMIETTLLAAGVSRAQVFIEHFGSSVPPPPNGADEKDHRDARTGCCDLVVSIAGRQYHLTCERGETILEAARRNGLDPPSACEAGVCAACVARVVDGRAEMGANNVLSEKEVAAGLVLTCQARPLGSYCSVFYGDDG